MTVVGFIFIAISLGFFAAALMSPTFLPLNKLWMKFGLLLSAIVSPIVMGLIFFGVFTPISIIMKVVGRDELCLQFKKENTHWKSPIMPKAKSYFLTNFEKGTIMEFIKEFLTFLRVRKKLWLAPVVIILMIFGGLLVVAQGSVFAPFIYTIF